ncbi:flagellar export protein FliJ [Enterobacterales bacterium CwR94]|nr:flagellar export protein FliJ [Enterobacterales bacterium CwR94]
MKTLKMIAALEQLRQMRERAVDDLSRKVSGQKQLKQRYLNNIDALNDLQQTSHSLAQNASAMSNLARYKSNIQRVINWQQQECALAEIKEKELQQALIKQACQEKSVAIVLKQQQDALAKAREAKQQKMTDAQAMQAWMRRRSGAY